MTSAKLCINDKLLTQREVWINIWHQSKRIMHIIGCWQHLAKLGRNPTPALLQRFDESCAHIRHSGLKDEALWLPWLTWLTSSLSGDPVASFRLQTLRTRGRESDIVVDYTYIHSHIVLQCIISNIYNIYILYSYIGVYSTAMGEDSTQDASSSGACEIPRIHWGETTARNEASRLVAVGWGQKRGVPSETNGEMLGLLGASLKKNCFFHSDLRSVCGVWQRPCRSVFPFTLLMSSIHSWDVSLWQR